MQTPPRKQNASDLARGRAVATNSPWPSAVAAQRRTLGPARAFRNGHRNATAARVTGTTCMLN
eukprot:SAG22_NODE_902_length_6593_cov_5.326763_2_plen_63_part_00